MPEPTSGEKHTDIIYTRIDIVVQLMLKNDRYLQSQRKSELVKTVMEQFNVSERTAERYVAEAKVEIKNLSKLKKEGAFKRAIRDREFIVNEAKTKDDLKLALDAMKDRDKLHGLYVEEVKHTGTISLKNIDVSKLTDDQLRTIKQKIKNNEPIEEYLKLIGLL